MKKITDAKKVRAVLSAETRNVFRPDSEVEPVGIYKQRIDPAVETTAVERITAALAPLGYRPNHTQYTKIWWRPQPSDKITMDLCILPSRDLEGNLGHVYHISFKSTMLDEIEIQERLRISRSLNRTLGGGQA